MFRNVTSTVFALRIDDVTVSSTDRPALNGLQIVGRSYPVDRVETTFADQGGNDFIVTGGGQDLVLGGKGDDTIQTFGPAVRGNVDADLVAGDNARVTLVNGVVTEIHTTSPTQAGNDTIVTGNGNDVVLGGEGNDTIRTGVEGAFDNGDVKVISVDFGGTSGDNSVTGTAAPCRSPTGTTSRRCIRTARRTTFAALLYNNGSLANGVRITYGEDLDSTHPHGAKLDSHDQIDPDTQNSRLYEGFLVAEHQDTLGVNVSGLSAAFNGGAYDVYVYLDADDQVSHENSSVRKVSLGATTFLLDDPDGQTFAGQFVEGKNYVVFHERDRRQLQAAHRERVAVRGLYAADARRPADRRRRGEG